MEIIVSAPKFQEIEQKMTLETIPEGYVRDYILIENRKYVCTGGCGTGFGDRWDYFFIDQIMSISDYDGALTPLSYGEHWKEVDLNNRCRSYAGMKVKCEGIPHVFVGEQIIVKSNQSEKQLELF